MLYTSTLSEVSNNINTGVEYEFAVAGDLGDEIFQWISDKKT